MSNVERIAATGSIETTHLGAIAQLLARKNAESATSGRVTVFSLMERDGMATLLENGKPVAQWDNTDPDIERHVLTLINGTGA